MNEYEITYLADPNLSEADKNQLDDAIDAEINKLKGEISVSAPPTGSPGSRRRLHYPVAGHRLSWLRTIQAQIDPEQIINLRQTIKKISGIIRLSILQTPLRESVSATIFDQLAAKEKRAAEKDSPKTKLEKPVTMAEVEEKIEQALDEEVK